MGDASSVGKVLKSIRSVLKSEGDKQRPHRRAYMLLIVNYGRHMAFPTEPPYCVAYAAEYWDKDPSRMTSSDPENHWYVTVSEKMVVRRLLSVPNWEPSERKHIKGGRLLIPRGVQYGPKLFPELVVLHATMQVRRSIQPRDRMLRCGPLGPSEMWIPSFPVSQGIWHCSLPRK